MASSGQISDLEQYIFKTSLVQPVEEYTKHISNTSHTYLNIEEC